MEEISQLENIIKMYEEELEDDNDQRILGEIDALASEINYLKEQLDET